MTAALEYFLDKKSQVLDPREGCGLDGDVLDITKNKDWNVSVVSTVFDLV